MGHRLGVMSARDTPEIADYMKVMNVSVRYTIL